MAAAAAKAPLRPSAGGPATTAGIHDNSASDATPVPGGSITYGLEADTSGGFCLYKAQLAIGGIQVARTIYDTLTMPGGDGKIHPYLAESVTGSANNTIWTIKLRPNIKFHDGSALDAATVKENLDHYRKDNQLFVFVFADVTAVDVVDSLTVKVTSKVPWTAFPWFLWSSSRLGIMAKAQMESPDCNTKLIGTGPFKYVSWKFGDKFVAKKNPNYWYKDPKTGAQLPYLDQITYVPQEDGAKRTGSLEAGDYQMIHTSDAQQTVKIRKDVSRGQARRHRIGQVPRTRLRRCSTRRKAPFNNLAARQAFAYAVDRDHVQQAAQRRHLAERVGSVRSGRRRLPRGHGAARLQSRRRPRRRPRRTSSRPARTSRSRCPTRPTRRPRRTRCWCSRCCSRTPASRCSSTRCPTRAR